MYMVHYKEWEFGCLVNLGVGYIGGAGLEKGGEGEGEGEGVMGEVLEGGGGGGGSSLFPF